MSGHPEIDTWLDRSGEILDQARIARADALLDRAFGSPVRSWHTVQSEPPLPATVDVDREILNDLGTEFARTVEQAMATAPPPRPPVTLDQLEAARRRRARDERARQRHMLLEMIARFRARQGNDVTRITES